MNRYSAGTVLGETRTSTQRPHEWVRTPGWLYKHSND